MATSTPDDLNSKQFSQVAATIQQQPPRLSTFQKPGPFAVVTKTDLSIKLPGETKVLADLILAKTAGAAPLIVLSHGNHSHKEAHRYQAERLASWGMHALVLQLPNEGRWLKNGRTVFKLIQYLQDKDGRINPKIDTTRIILAGHSFGGSAITVAAGMGARVLGLILLDPAVVHDKLKTHLRKIRVPIMLLGADQSVFRSRKRRYFYKYSGGDIGEISVRGATHDDAQFPSMFALHAFGVDPYTSEHKQNVFASALTATAFSLGSKKTLDFAWHSFNSGIIDGDLTSPRRRDAAH